MKATHFEYKYRFLIHAVIYLLAFQVPWNNALNLTDETTWLLGDNLLFRQHLLSFIGAANLILVLSMVFLGLAAWLRTWGSAYVGASVVHSSSMHGDAMLADGPYRRTRNPLYLGTLLHTIGLTLLMTPSGAIFAVVLINAAIGLIQEAQTGDDPERIREAMSGNLCRCGAYAGITQAVLDAKQSLERTDQGRAA